MWHPFIGHPTIQKLTPVPCGSECSHQYLQYLQGIVTQQLDTASRRIWMHLDVLVRGHVGLSSLQTCGTGC